MAAASAAAAASAGAGPSSAGSLEAVLPPWFATEVAGWLRDDAPTFDIGGYVVGDSVEEAALLAKTPCVVAGVPWVNAVFAQLDCTVEWAVAEGDVIAAVPARVATVRGACRKLLLGERTALNIISRASGIATAARELAAAARAAGWRGEVAGTRKLTPGFRLVEKYALLVGGVSTHRMDLSSMVMLKGACAGCFVWVGCRQLVTLSPCVLPPHCRQPCVGGWQHHRRGGGGAACRWVQHQD